MRFYQNIRCKGTRRVRQIDRKNDTAPLNRKCDHCLRSPHRVHSVSARRGPQCALCRCKGTHFFDICKFLWDFCCLSQARQEFDAIDRPVRHFLDAGSNTRDVEQQECKGHKTRHPDDLTEDLLECYGHDGEAQSRKSKV